MHDIRAIRDDPEAFDKAWAARGLSAQTPAILALDAKLRACLTSLQADQARRNEASRLIGKAKAEKNEAEAAERMAEVEKLKLALSVHTHKEQALAEQLRTMLAALPNLLAPDVPPGRDESDNLEVRRWGEPFAMANPKDHVELGGPLMDFEGAARISGSRFVALKGPLARLERALGQFMLDMQTYGTDKLPKFADDLFRTTDGRWLIPTAEVSLANLVREQILDEGELPLRLTALTPCFRLEAGASGKDTRGMIRLHQFNKVELVSIVAPEQSEAEHERMTANAEAVLKRLELPYRVVNLCAGDIGFSMKKTYDLEVWLPSQKTYREVSSCSNAGEFQARRMDARCRRPGEKGARFVHTLNGSGLAVGRTLVAILENYQDEHGRVAIPQALHPYLPGLSYIQAGA